MHLPRVLPIFIACILLPTTAISGQPAELVGQSAKFRVWFDDPRDGTNPDIHFAAFDISASDVGGYPIESKPVSFESECKSTRTEIVCRSGGRTPLAGATYRLTADGTPTCPGDADYRFTCVKGCKLGVPRYLRIDVYEC